MSARPGYSVEAAGSVDRRLRDWHLAPALAITASLLLAGAVGAFWPRYLGQPLSTLDRYTHLHAGIGLLWMLLLIAQPLTIRSGRIAWHRALGRIAIAVAPAFVIGGVLLAHFRFAAMSDAQVVAEGHFLFLPLLMATLFALAATLGFIYRRSTPLHARFMATTGLLLIDPVLVRLLAFYLPELPDPNWYPFITFGVIDAAFVMLLMFFRPPLQRRAPLLAFLLVMVMLQAMWFVFAPTPAWHAFVLWFRTLPLT